MNAINLSPELIEKLGLSQELIEKIGRSTMYILIGIGPDGTRCSWVANPVVPEHWLMPGEMGFVVQPLDSKMRYTDPDEKNLIPSPKFL